MQLVLGVFLTVAFMTSCSDEAHVKQASIPRESMPGLLQFSDISRGSSEGTWNHTPLKIYPNINFQFFEDELDHKYGFFRSYEEGLSCEFNGGSMTFNALSSTQAQVGLYVEYNIGSNRPVYEWNVDDHISCLIEVTKSNPKTMKAACNKGKKYPTSVDNGLLYSYVQSPTAKIAEMRK